MSMGEAEIEGILSELDKAYEDLKSARKRLAELLPMSATKPGDSGQARVEFVVGLDPETQDDDEGEERLRQINAEVWEEAQKALINAQAKVEAAHKTMRRYLSERP